MELAEKGDLRHKLKMQMKPLPLGNYLIMHHKSFFSYELALDDASCEGGYIHSLKGNRSS